MLLGEPADQVTRATMDLKYTVRAKESVPLRLRLNFEYGSWRPLQKSLLSKRSALDRKGYFPVPSQYRVGRKACGPSAFLKAAETSILTLRNIL